MRQAMANAEVGDDVFREDPTVRSLEVRVAALTGKEAALFVPSGTMANQLALLLSTQRGDEILVGEGAHILAYETGGASVLAQVQCAVIGAGGFYLDHQVRSAIRPPADWNARVTLIALENTHNRGGGIIWPESQRKSVITAAKELNLRVHLDGARLWNAAAARSLPVSTLCDGADTVSVCLSKGLGAPVGSLLCSSRALIEEARRWRKRLGGGMRQVGILAAAGHYALEHNLSRIADDHDNAMRLFIALKPTGCVQQMPQSNILFIDLNGDRTADEFARRAAERNIGLSVFGPQRIRVVTHLDVSSAEIKTAGEVLCELLSN